MNFNLLFEKWINFYSFIGFRYILVSGLAFIVFYIILKNKLKGRKIQDKVPAITDYTRDILYSVVSIGIFAILALLSFTVLRPYNNLYIDINEHSKIYYAFTFIWMFFVHDAYFYWTHRIMHHPKIFKIVHLVHHKSNNPSPFTAYAFHPIEAFIEAFIIIIFAFSIPLHPSAIVMYMFFQIVYNVYGHLGYEIMPKSLNKIWLGKYFNTSVAHNMHHKYSVKNYGLWTTIWDRAFGTLHEQYEQAYENTTMRKD